MIDELEFFYNLLNERPELPDDIQEAVRYFQDYIFIIKRLQKRFGHV